MDKEKTRPYPIHCTSAYCGRTECTGCKHLPVLEDFEKWRKERAAIQEDPVWSPSYWTATR